MWRGGRALRAAAGGSGRIPNPGSSLLNPRSHRARLRKMMATHQGQTDNFEKQAVFADVGGTGEAGVKREALNRGLGKSKRQRKSHHVRRVGGDVAERVKCMTDGEWESVPMEDKHAFTKYISEALRERPTEVTEQQRRRYFETTMADPRDLDPHRTVRDEYQRIKMGLPVELKSPQRTLGVSQAMYEAGDASLFDPESVHKLENAMTEIKQVFADYIDKRREGISTESERRRLANMTAELNLETQRHLAHLFKYSEERLRQIAMEEREQQLGELVRLREAASNPSREGVRRRGSRAKRRHLLKRSVSKAIGLDVGVVETLLNEMEAQEQFLQFCEVFARLSLGKGFKHTDQDETLDEYTDSLRRLYSVDAEQLSTLDLVQYLAAKDNVHPVDWAKRWYERALLLPLQNTPEYKRLQEIQQSDAAALQLKTETAASSQPETPDGREASTDGHQVACAAEAVAAQMQEQKVIRIVEKMFLRPDDARLQSIHEKRLRYLAYLQMERQIKQARENARQFEGVEHSPEAQECRALYKQLLKRRGELTNVEGNCSLPHAADLQEMFASQSPVSTAEVAVTAGQPNIFQDAEATTILEKMCELTGQVIRRQKVESKAAKKAESVRRVLESLRAGPHSVAAELRALQEEKKRKVSQRLLSVIEGDVRSEMQWLEAMREAERPPLLPIPEGMSYVSAADVQTWKDIRKEDEDKSNNPFTKRKRVFQPTLFGQTWRIPDRPMLFWGTGAKAVQQALQHAAEDAERKRRGEPLAPPYPCAENPWGWRLAKDILED